MWNQGTRNKAGVSAETAVRVVVFKAPVSVLFLWEKTSTNYQLVSGEY
jgi:hypothetical protein